MQSLSTPFTMVFRNRSSTRIARVKVGGKTAALEVDGRQQRIHVGLVQSDEELMRAYVEGDSEAFRQLFERYGPILLNLTRRHLPSEEEAREVVQQTFFQLHVARKDFRLDAKLKPWIFTIAMNLVRQYYRRKGRRKETDLDKVPGTSVSEAPSAETNMERSADALRVRDALTMLSARQREVVELHWFQDRPFAEVASIVGATEGSVRVRAHRAYRKLKELLGEEFGGKAPE